MARVEYSNELGNYFQVYDSDSLNEINECLLDHFDKLPRDKSPELPVYVSLIHSLKDPQQLKHIGYVKLIFNEDRDGHTVHHYTVGRNELPNEWSSTDFYSGQYGQKSE